MNRGGGSGGGGGGGGGVAVGGGSGVVDGGVGDDVGGDVAIGDGNSDGSGSSGDDPSGSGSGGGGDGSSDGSGGSELRAIVRAIVVSAGTGERIRGEGASSTGVPPTSPASVSVGSSRSPMDVDSPALLAEPAVPMDIEPISWNDESE